MRYLVFALLAACGVEEDSLAESRPPLVLGNSVAYFDTTTSSLIVVDPAAPKGEKLSRILVGGKATTARQVPRPDGTGSQIIVVDPGGETLHVIRDARGDASHLRIGVPLDAVDVSPDGRWAVVYQPDDTSPSRTLFAFPNTLAIASLDPERPAAQNLRLPTPGARPLRVVFAERLALRGSEPDGTPVSVDVPFALVFAHGGVVPLDLDNATAGALVPLAGGDRDVIPAEVLFTNNRGDSGEPDAVERAFVRTTEGELFVLALGLSPARLLGDTNAMAVSVAVENVVTPDAYVYDIELFFAPDGNALLLAAAGNELVLVDAYSGVASRFPQEVYVDTLARFDDPHDGRSLALGYTQAQADVLRLDPLGLDLRRSTGIETLHLASPVGHIDIAGGAGRAVVQYTDNRDLGVLDLERGGALLDMRFARSVSARALEGDRLWVAGTSPEDETPHFAEVRLLSALDATDVELDFPGRSVGRAGPWVWVDHDDPFGAITLFPADDLRRESAVTFEGVLFTDILNVKE